VGQGSQVDSSISADYVYLHVGGQPSVYAQAQHNAVNEWYERYGKERLLLYMADTSNDYLFANSNSSSKKVTVLSKLGITGSASTGNTAALTTSESEKPVYKYLVFDGPFGPSGPFNRMYMDGINTRVHASSLPASAVPLIVDNSNANNVVLFVDPLNNIVYNGESQIFNSYIESAATTLNGGSTDSDANLSRFLANLLAYIVNASQYGTHFTDLFLPGNTELYNDAFVEE
jgi:hypothetical protein